jgi:putative transposase
MPVICQFIDARKARSGVVPICRALSGHGVQIAPRAYRASRSRPPSRRALRDTAITGILAGICEPGPRGRRPPEALHGSLKMRACLQRQGIPVARCTVGRLMRASGWRGTARARTDRTTVPRPGDQRAPGLVNRQFTMAAPGQLHVADFTCVPMDGGGLGYAALVIDALAGLITGRECPLPKETAFAGRAIRQAAAPRRRQGRPLSGTTIHHSDAGPPCTSVRCGETLQPAGMIPSTGTAGDAYDNALAETTMGLHKTECARSDSPFRAGPLRTVADPDDITSAWVY